MISDATTVSSFAVDDVAAAQRFYGDTLGPLVDVVDEEAGLLVLHPADDRDIFIYGKPDFAPATYTMLNFQVDDVDAAVDELSGRGVTFERYDGFDQDEKGIARGPGPQIAWFTDPAGNILAVLQQP